MHFSFIIIATLVACASCEYSQFEDVPVIDSGKQSSEKIHTRVFGGKPARPGQFPYQVGLIIYVLPREYVTKFPIAFWCGGSLISKDYVLTAAHCFYVPAHEVKKVGGQEKAIELKQKTVAPTIDVFLGLTNRKEIQQGIPTDQKNYKIHEKYDQITHVNDIGLIKLPEPAKLSDLIQIVNLPRKSISDLVGKSVISSGWGKIGDTQEADMLQYANLQIVPIKDCQIFEAPVDDSKQICINAAGRSMCKGDSGGPHVITEADGSKTVVGVTSFGGTSCTVGKPQVLTRVSYYLDWIQRNTGIQTGN